MPNDKVAKLEARYGNIQLKALGAHGMEATGDPWTLTFWSLCGREYVLLERRAVVKDVLAAPPSIGNEPSLLGSCAVDGTKVSGTSVAFGTVKDKRQGSLQAWRVDDKALKFVALKGKEIRCE